MVTDDTTDSAVSLAVDSGCRLVVSGLGTAIPTRTLAGLRYTSPKVYDTGSSPAGVGSTGLAGSTGGVAEDPVAMVLDAAATVAATQKIDVQAVQIIYNEAGTQEYRDYVAAQYVRNTKNQTVGVLEPYDGSCQGSYIDENVLYGPYANDILSCFYKETYQRPEQSRVRLGRHVPKGSCHHHDRPAEADRDL